MSTEHKEQLTPQQRLAISRRALVQHLQGVDEEHHAPRHAKQGHGMMSSLMARTPWLGVARSIARRWWSRHPANAAGQLARPVLERFAQQQPAKLIAASAAVGALIVLVRPWRLLSLTTILGAILKTSSVAGMVTTVMHREENHSKDFHE